jgi:hypothetical protein
MNFNDVVSYVVAQPWSPAVPFGVAVLADWALGSFEAWRAGVFAKEKVFDWTKTTVGWQKGAAIVGTIAMAYFLRGKADAVAQLVGVTAVSGAAFLVVGHDVILKLQALPAAFSSKPPAPPADKPATTPPPVPVTLA